MTQQDLLAGMRARTVGTGADHHSGSGQAGSYGASQKPLISHQDLQALTFVEGVIFDHDGVCINSEFPAMRSAYQLTVEQFTRRNIVPPEEEAFMKLAGRPYVHILEALEKQLGRVVFTNEEKDLLRTEEEKRAQAALRVHATAIPGIVQTLEILRHAKVPFVMASTSIRDRLNVCLRTGGISDYFPTERVVSAVSDFSPAKPKPEPDAHLKAWDILREMTGKSILRSVVAIEDSPSGAGGMKNAGIPFRVGFVGGDHIPVPQRPERSRILREDFGCYDVIDDMHQFPSVLVRIGTEIALSRR